MENEERRTESEKKAKVMNRDIGRDLKRLERMAFGRLKHCGPLIRQFHAARERIEREPEPEWIWNVYDWLLTAFPLWPLDFEQMVTHLMGSHGRQAQQCQRAGASQHSSVEFFYD